MTATDIVYMSESGRTGRVANGVANMPELVDVHGELVGLAGDDDTAAAMLTLWNPPPFIGRSVAVLMTGCNAHR